MAYDFNSNIYGHDDKLIDEIQMSAQAKRINLRLIRYDTQLSITDDNCFKLNRIPEFNERIAGIIGCADYMTCIFNILYDELDESSLLKLKNNMLEDPGALHLESLLNMCSWACADYVDFDQPGIACIVNRIDPGWYFNYLRFIQDMYPDCEDSNNFSILFPKKTRYYHLKPGTHYMLSTRMPNNIKYDLTPKNCQDIIDYVMSHKELCSLISTNQNQPEIIYKQLENIHVDILGGYNKNRCSRKNNGGLEAPVIIQNVYEHYAYISRIYGY